MDSIVDGVLANSAKIRSINFPGRSIRLLQILVHDGFRMSLVDVHDYSNGGFNGGVGRRARLRCRVVFYKGMKQYHYHG